MYTEDPVSSATVNNSGTISRCKAFTVSFYRDQQGLRNSTPITLSAESAERGYRRGCNAENVSRRHGNYETCHALTVEFSPMHSTSRLVSLLILGIGVALMAAGFLAPRFYHAGDRLPLDATALTYTLTDTNGAAQILSAEGSSPYEGPVTSNFHVDIQEPADATSATVRIGESTFRGEETANNLLNANVWTLSIDRTTGEALSPAAINHTLAFPAAEIPVEGYVVKFPANAEKTTYPVMDTTLRQPRDAVFEEELSMSGRTIYRYHQEIEPVNVATIYASAFSTTTMEQAPATTTGYYYHSGNRDFFVDQQTGIIVGISADIDDYYADREGNRGPTALRLNAATTDSQQAELIELAKSVPSQKAFEMVRLGLILGGAALSLIGVLGLFLPHRKAAR
ncbi:MAG: DUF3068 domain-containing protein [Corynebacterium sp.]|nr:DUF3068 domain-containing protein [Corynebacterium sp.]